MSHNIWPQNVLPVLMMEIEAKVLGHVAGVYENRGEGDGGPVIGTKKNQRTNNNSNGRKDTNTTKKIRTMKRVIPILALETVVVVIVVPVADTVGTILIEISQTQKEVL